MKNADQHLQEAPEILVSVVRAAPFFKGLLGEEVGIYVSDLNRYLYCSPGSVQLPVRVNDEVKEGSSTMAAIQSGRRVRVKIGRELYGLPYIGTAYPVSDEHNRVVGAVVTSMPVAAQENLSALSVQMEKQISDISMATSNLSAVSEELAATAENLNGNARGIREEIKKTDGIVALIRDIAEQTHMLGLNAAIEAARVGDAGRGFNVVAGEIRRLSQDTQHSVKDILQTLQEMQHSIMDLTRSIEQMAAATQEQAASAEEISASVNQLETVAAHLKEQAGDLLK